MVSGGSGLTAMRADLGSSHGRPLVHGTELEIAMVTPTAVTAEPRRVHPPRNRHGFVAAEVSTNGCEARDRKGQHAKAHAGLLRGFTGVSDPAGRALAHLQAEGYLSSTVAGG